MIDTNIPENAIAVKFQIERMGGLQGWPYENAAQIELGRVAAKYAKDIQHLDATITRIVESGDPCPRPAFLRNVLAPMEDPAFINFRRRPTETRCKICDDSGWAPMQRGIYTGVYRCDCRPVPQPPAQPQKPSRGRATALVDTARRAAGDAS